MKNILIIGGSSGVGEALIKRVGEKNNIVATYNNTFKENTSNVKFVKYNVIENNPEELNIDSHIDCIVYCPGTINLKPFHRYTETELIDDFKINVLGFFIKFLQCTPLETVNPLTLRLDFPLFLNRPPANDKDYFMFRWLFGISKLF